MPAPHLAAISVTELLCLRAQNQSDHLIIYTGLDKVDGLYEEIDDEGKGVRDGAVVMKGLTCSQLDRAVHRLAPQYFRELGLQDEQAIHGVPPVRVAAILSPTSVHLTLLELVLCTRLNLTPLLLSTNNSPAAVAHLVKLTKAEWLIYGPGERWKENALEAENLLKKEGWKGAGPNGDRTVKVVQEKRRRLWGPGGIDDLKTEDAEELGMWEWNRLSPEQESERPALILHSSGSTGHPKPIFVTHSGLLANAANNFQLPGYSTLPVFHGNGHFAFFRSLYPAVPITFFPPHLPITASNVCAVLRQSRRALESHGGSARQLYAVPYVLKLLSESEEGRNELSTFDIITFSGASVPDDLGDRLVKDPNGARAKLVSLYGTTETGALLSSKRDFEKDGEWNWLRVVGPVENYLIFEARGASGKEGEGETYELVVKDGWPPKVESNREDGSYATKDLFVRHPDPRKNWWKYVGRLDDTIVQLLGEKTNPVPIELSIRGNSPYVQEAIVFGAGRPCIGCLILPSDLAQQNQLWEDREAFLSKIWPVVQQANAEAPSHSQLVKEMIEILPYGTEIPIATKMSILRPACYAKFKDLMESIYQRYESGSSSVIKQSLSSAELEIYLRQRILAAMGVDYASSTARKLANDTDLFAFGVDSLQASRVRNVCQRELYLSGKLLGQNVVYEHPSISALVTYLSSVQQGDDGITSSEKEYILMLNMVEEFASKLESPKNVPYSQSLSEESSGEVVILTGATGSLGAHILFRLLSSPSVSRVICLSRAKTHPDSRHRVCESLKLRGLSLAQAQDSKWESFAADLSHPELGLGKHNFDRIQREATIVLHNAWPVNFSLNLLSFREHIQSCLNLINFCIISGNLNHRPPSFFFSSSVSTQQGRPDIMECPESFPANPQTAAATGYARSKWVVEKLIERITNIEPENLRATVLRIGQLVGDSRMGVWNTTEAIPLIFKSAETIGALPSLDEVPSYLPVDYAADGIVDALLSPPGSQCVFHIVNPNQVTSWNQILGYLQMAGLKFDIVDRKEWLRRLQEGEQDGSKNPTAKLLPFYQNRFGNSTHRKPIVFRTDFISKVSSHIKDCPAVDERLVQLWVDQWRQAGFLRSE